MNKLFNLFKFVAIVTTLILVSCQKDNMSNNNTLGTVQTFELNISSNNEKSVNALLTDAINVNLSLKEGQTITDDKGMSVNIAFTGTAILADGSNRTISNGSELFSDFKENETIKKGEKGLALQYHVNNPTNYKSVSGSFKISSRGVIMKTSELPITLFSKTQISLLVNGTKLTSPEPISVVSTRKFSFSFETTENVDEAVKVNITRNEDTKVQLEGLSNSLTIAQASNSITSGDIIASLNTGVTEPQVAVTLTFSVESNKYELSSTSVVINVVSPTNGLTEENKVSDERWVYPFSDEVFVSSGTKAAVESWSDGKKVLVEMQAETPHPNSELASKGWKFRNALEFSPIDALTFGGKVNEFGNRVPHFMGEQNVQNFQDLQAIYNDRFTNLNNDGNLVVWSSKGDDLQANWWSRTNNKEPHGHRDYGVGALYISKFRAGNANTYKWKENKVPIMPGTRVEVRMRVLGKIYNFNPAVWFQGNMENTHVWPYYGEIDLFEAPQNENGGRVYQTYHWSNQNNQNHQGPTTGPVNGVDVKKYNIYWMEWRSNEEVAVGINGKEMKVIRKSDYPNVHWPFDATYNKAGLHMLITFATMNINGSKNKPWGDATGNTSEFDQYLKDIPYASSKENPDTPRMEIDYIRFYTNSSYVAGEFPANVTNAPLF